MPLRPLLGTVLFAALPLVGGTQPSRTLTLPGDRAAVWNLVGSMTIRRGAGDETRVEVTVRGRDANLVRVEQRTVRGTSAVVVRYPDDDLVHGAAGRGRTTVQVGDDGTWGGRQSGRGVRRTIRSSGRGVEAWADVVIHAPASVRLEAHQGVGTLTATDATMASLLADVLSADVSLARLEGEITVDAGSGRTTGSDLRGSVSVDAGSGDTELSRVRGARVQVDGGSGSVTLDELVVDELAVDVGSGTTRATRVDAGAVHIDSGSGSVWTELTRERCDVVVDVGSGAVDLLVPSTFDARFEIDTGSGGVRTDVPLQVTRADRHSLTGTMGDGRGRVRIDTGSGAVRIGRAR